MAGVEDDSLIDRIADGYAFDSTEAIRAMARRLKSGGSATMDRDIEAGAMDPGMVLAKALGNQRLAGVLVMAGFVDVESVRRASDDELLAVNGIGEKAVATIRKALA